MIRLSADQHIPADSAFWTWVKLMIAEYDYHIEHIHAAQEA